MGKLSDKYGKISIFQICVLAALPLVFAVTNMPTIHAALVLSVFGLWFSAATGRGVTAQAMVSNVVSPEHRGSFQSFNSSIQQLGSGLASLASGFMVIKEPSGRLLHYDWVGYLSIAVLLTCVFLGQKIFRTLDNKAILKPIGDLEKAIA
ncbi:MAG: MFS transporter [Saprospiraceae bacterium]|nr:MFS transporter [Saprospiraceae bacterium]